MTKIKGSVVGITFRNEENGFTIARFKPENDYVINIIGQFTSIAKGEQLSMEGTWGNHPKFGKQFKVKSYTSSMPVSLHGMEQYLSSGLINNIGPHFAKKMVNHFGTEIFEIMENNPERLIEIPGIGEERIKSVIDSVNSQKSIRELMTWLSSFKIDTSIAVKIFKRYGKDSISEIRENPYNLAMDTFGIGFKIIDTLALKLGVKKNDQRRIQAGIKYVLKKSTKSGHVYFPMHNLIIGAVALLGSFQSDFNIAISNLCESNDIIVEEDRVYLKVMYNYEASVAAQLITFGKSSEFILERLKEAGYDTEEKMDEKIRSIASDSKIVLEEFQFEAVREALSNQFVIITGGPGTGKSTITKVILDFMLEIGMRVELASPTGRAAKRLSETTNHEARTIHRLLEFTPEGFSFNQENQLYVDAIIIDEASMLDIELAFSLIQAVPDDAVLIFIGDVDQLPSVGPGAVLQDIIDSGSIPVVRLTKIFRQAAGSYIVKNAHRINSGRGLCKNMPIDSDFEWIDVTSEIVDNAAPIVADAVINSVLRMTDNYDIFKDIQVLTPMHDGESGTKALNKRMQDIFNPQSFDKNEIKIKDSILREGDRVIHMKNNYELGVFNGDTGIIGDIRVKDRIVIVNIDGNDIIYKSENLNQLKLAYAITVHKSQGSEYPCVIMPVTTAHWIMMQRNLVYTGLTRAKKHCIMVGQSKALRRAIENNRANTRFTHLKYKLMGDKYVPDTKSIGDIVISL